jgi:hypothetical protein
MAAKPKLTAEQWSSVREHWERDQREGYAWLIDELGLPVSAPAVRKAAIRDGWAKQGTGDECTVGATAERSPNATRKAARDGASSGPARKVSKVPGNHRAKVSETMGETIETMAERPLPTISEVVERDPDQFGVLAELSDLEEIFVREYMVDWNGTQAAIRAGYSAKSAAQTAWFLLRKPKVQVAVETLASARARRLGIDAEELMRVWSAVVNLDANEISQLRRVCCPYCWGREHQRQFTPAGLEAAKRQHDKDRARRLGIDSNDDIGDFPPYEDSWYDKRKPPAEDCPECHGEGMAETFYADTRHLSPAARLVYAGVKEGRDGIEVLTMSKEKAADNLARALGLFKDKDPDVTVVNVAGEELLRVYEAKMQQARARQMVVLQERGMIESVDARPDAGGL